MGSGWFPAALVVGVAAGTWWLVDDLREPPTVSISATVYGQCGRGASTVDVSSGGEPLGSGSIGLWEPTGGGLCAATVSVNSVPSRDVYTVDSGSLSATFTAGRIVDGMTVRMSER